jgi:hypothetical protein
MALLEIDYLDYLVTAADANDNSFVVNAPHSYQAEKSYVIEVVTGTFQFCLGQAVGANSPVHAAGAKLVFTALANIPIFYKAGLTGHTFTVGF